MRAIRESFLREIWGRAAPTYDWFQAIHESFLREILTSYGSAKVFSLESLPLYGTLPLYILLMVYTLQVFVEFICNENLTTSPVAQCYEHAGQRDTAHQF